MNFANFEPIVPNIKDNAIKYYEENGMQFPDNNFFTDYFKIPKQEQPKVDFNQTMIKNHPLYNKNIEVKVPEKDLSVDLTDYKIIAPADTTIAARHNNPGNLMYVGQHLAYKGEPKKRWWILG